MVNQLVHELGLQGAIIERIRDGRAIRKFMPPDEIPRLVIDEHLVSTQQPLDRETLSGCLKGSKQAAN